MESKQENIALEPEAANKLAEHLKQSKADCLRLAVEGGGCSGFQYKLFLDNKKEEDHLFKSQGQKIVCDPVSLTFVKGSTIGYQDGLHGAGFIVSNPNISGACGCGSSFYVD